MLGRKKKKSPELYKRISIDTMLEKFSKDELFGPPTSDPTDIEAKIKILSPYGINGPFEFYDMFERFAGPGDGLLEAGFIFKNPQLIGILGFEDNSTNQPDIAYATYNGEKIMFGSISFTPSGIKIDENGNILKGNFERKETKNCLDLPTEYIAEQEVSKLPSTFHLSSDDVAAKKCIYYANYLINQKPKVV